MRSTIQRFRYRRSARPSCVAVRTRFFLCGQISSIRAANDPATDRCPPGMQSVSEEHPCRRPPPSTSSPCPAWFFRLRAPFFAGAKLPSRNDSLHFNCWRSFNSLRRRARCSARRPAPPVAQPPPARRRMRIFHIYPREPPDATSNVDSKARDDAYRLGGVDGLHHPYRDAPFTA